MRNITIKKVMNGFRVKVGCQEVVFGSKKKLLNELSRYIDNPVEVEKEYREKYNYNEATYVQLNGQVYGTGPCWIGPIETEETQGVKVELNYG